MKALLLIAALVSSNAFAASKELIYTCTKGEEITLKMYETDDGNRIDLKLQSVGDSYPTYHFKNVRMERGMKKIGAPVVYSNSQLRLLIRHIAGTKATLDVPSLGLKGEQLVCR